jgi:hypothetical protein
MKNKLVVVGDSYCVNYVNQMNQGQFKDSNWKYIEPFPIWPEIVSNHLNLPLVNLSIQGLGNWAIYSIALDAIVSEKDIGKLIVVWSGSNRINYEDPDKKHWASKNDERESGTHPKGNIRAYLRYVYSLQEICKIKNVDVIMFQSICPIVRREKWNHPHFSKDYGIKVGMDLIESPYFTKIDESVFPNFPGDRVFGGKSISMSNLLAKVGWKKCAINDEDRHPNEFGSEVIADHVTKYLTT